MNQLLAQTVPSRYLNENQLKCLLRDLFGEGLSDNYKVGLTLRL